MKKQIYDVKNGLSYTLHGDYYLPDLALPEEEKPTYGKYSMLRRTFLKEHRKGLYMSMFLQGKMVEHLNQIDRAATERMELLVVKMTERQGVTERLKAEDQLLWVGMMNNIRTADEEIVIRELIYV